MDILIIKILLAQCSIAVISCWLAYQSTLIEDLKKLFQLSIDQKTITWKPWFILGHIFNEIKYLVNCPFCLSYHISWITLYWHFKLSFFESLLYAGITLIFVELYRKLSL